MRNRRAYWSLLCMFVALVIARPEDMAIAAPPTTNRFTGTLQGSIDVPLPIGGAQGGRFFGATQGVGPTPLIPLDRPPNAIVRAASAVGSQPGTGSVTPTGAYRYEMPIEVPPGRLGMEPHLSLVYSSSGGNGPLGVGWSLSGLSSIQPCAKTFATDGVALPVHLDGSDDYCWDQQKLVQIADGTYRTEEDAFARIVANRSNNAISSFTVQTKEGHTLTFSNSFGGPVLYDFLLASEQDELGNSVDYSYTTVSASEYYPHSIIYTGFRGTPGQRTILFAYEARPDPIAAVRANVIFSTTQRLRTITCSAPNPSTPSEIWSYVLTYQNESPATGSGRSLLSNVRRKGNLGGRLLDKTFGWESTKGGQYQEVSGKDGSLLPIAAKSVNPAVTVTTPLTSDMITQDMVVADFDHDGRDDLLVGNNGGVPLLFYSKFGEAPLSTWKGMFGLQNISLKDARVGDLDGDGTIELIAPSNNIYVSFGWNNDAQDFGPIANLSPYVNTINGESYPLFLNDFDGDGLVDLFIGTPPPIVDDTTNPQREPAQPLGVDYTWSLLWNKGGTWAAPLQVNLPHLGLVGPITGSPYQAYSTNDGGGRSTLFATASYFQGENNFSSAGLISHPFGISLDKNGTLVTVSPAAAIENSFYTAYADMNGDSIEELVQYLDGSANRKFCIMQAPVFGAPAAPSFTVADQCVTLAPLNINPPHKILPGVLPWKVNVYDLDGDGRDDFLLTHINQDTGIPDGPGYRIYLDATGQIRVASFGHAPIVAGDFDGDGHVDVIDYDDKESSCQSEGIGCNTYLHSMQDSTSDLMTSVSDEGAIVAAEAVTYSTQWWPDIMSWARPSWPPVDAIPRSFFPQQSIRRGMTVVREHDVYQGDDVGEYFHSHYAYSSPQFDLHGRGFLGFQVMDQWQPDVPTETVTSYALTGSNGFYPGAFRPTEVLRMTPIVTHSLGETPTIPGIANTRLSDVVTSYTVDPLNDGKTFFVHPRSWVANEWEELLFIDDSTDLADKTDAAPHVFTSLVPGASLAPSPLDAGAFSNTVPIRRRNGTLGFDPFGNVTEDSWSTDGGYASSTKTTFYPPQAWLIARPKTRTFTAGKASALPAPRTTDYTFEGNLLKSVTTEKGNADKQLPITYTYSRDGSFGQIIKMTASAPGSGEQDRTVTIEYDPAEHIFATRRTNALGHSETVLPDQALGVPVAASDVNNVVTRQQFDEFGRLRGTFPTLAGATFVTYGERQNSSGVVVTTTGQDSSATITELDLLGRPVVESHLGFVGTPIVTQNTYDVSGRLVQWTRPGENAPSDKVNFQEWDSLGRLSQRFTQAGGSTHYQHVSPTRTRWTDANGHFGDLETDVDGRVTTSIQFNPSNTPVTTTYLYGDFGELTGIQDTKKNLTTFVYDGLGRRIMTNDPDSGINKVDYNGFGDVVDRTPADGVVTTFMHDALGRTIQERVAIPKAPDDITTYVWDEALNGRGKIASSTSPDGVVREFGYDDAGRPNATNWTVDGSTFQMRYFYDGLGRPSGIQYPRAPGHASFTVNTSYNAFGYAQSVSRNGKPYWTTTLMTVDDLPTIGDYGDGTVGLRIYDAATGLLANRTDEGVAASFSNSYNYDASGRVTSQEEFGTKRKETFDYDGLDRLASWRLDIAGRTDRREAYAYDDIGNLTTVFSAAERGGAARYEYGQNGAGPHALSGSRQGAVLYDARGRATTEPGRTIAYSEFNLPTSIQPIGSTAQQAMTFEYDAEHHRVLKSVPGSFGTAAKTITLNELYERHQSGGQTTDVYHVYGPDGLVAQVSVDEKTQNETLEYVHGDRLGSVAALTSASHAPILSYYQPFGRRSTVSGIPTASAGSDVDLGFQGLLHDDDLELIDQRGRIYDPVIRRFLTPDTHIDQPLNSQSLNTYSFVMNDPVNHTDPSGFGNPDPNGPDCPDCPPWFPPIFGVGFNFDFLSGHTSGHAGGTSSRPAHISSIPIRNVPLSTSIPAMPERIERSVLPTAGVIATVFAARAGIPVGPGAWDGVIEGSSGFVAGLGLGLTPFGAVTRQTLSAFDVLKRGTRDERIGRDIGELIGGFITGVSGITGAAVSFVASGTGLGAIPGVPAFAISTAAVTGGFGNVLAAAKDLSTLREGDDAAQGKPRRGIGGSGWRGDAQWKGAVRLVNQGGDIRAINGRVPTIQEATDLINEGGGEVLRVDPPHAAPNPHNFPHINYLTSNGVKGAIEIMNGAP